MNVRLVAYRKATSDATYTTGYNLDLQEEPNVSINYKFSELSDPSVRKGSYSQTFKLPFTDNNNQFFQEWYNVNLETLVFSAREAFDVVLYVGTIPQFEGLLHLKAVYKKAGYYEVVILSSIAHLFTNIGEKRLKDVFIQANGSYTDEYNHTYDYTTSTNNVLYNSWTNTLQNTAGTTLSDGTVAKIVYPMSINIPGFYYDVTWDSDGFWEDGTFLRLTQDVIDDLISQGMVTPTSLWSKSVSFGQFKPAIQIRELFQKIIAQAGMSYTSTFIDSTYFRKIYMTLGGFSGTPSAVTVRNEDAPSGAFTVGHDVEQLNFTAWLPEWDGSYEVILPYWQSIKANIGTDATCMYYNDFDGLWDDVGGGLYYFHKADVSMTELYIRHYIELENIGGVNYGGIPSPFVTLNYKVVGYDPSTNSALGTISTGVRSIQLTNTNFNGFVNYTLDISEMPPNTHAYVMFKPGQIGRATDASATARFFKKAITPVGCAGVLSSVTLLAIWGHFTQGAYGAVIDVPANVDPEITQKEFLKDIIQRFNLVILTNPDDDTNLLIEPYNDFIASGVLKNWTDKLDVSKEMVVKDTSEIQKKTIHFTDQEDDDLYNNSIRENFPQANVYGNIKIQEHNNEFALGELKNEPLFAPYINSVVFKGPDESDGTMLNMVVQYEFTSDASLIDLKEGWIVKPTKPKLFWYNGTPTEIKRDGYDASINLHTPTASTINAFKLYDFPVCTPFDITPGDGSNPDNEYTLTPDNKSLYWNANPPLYGSQLVYNYTNSYGSWFKNSLFGLYWRAFIDNIYNKDARIMECYMNLNEVDIFQFSFADEIFIKDSYWRILEITNYQVGAKASTKVKLIKSLDTLSTNTGCDYVLGEINGNNVSAGYYVWCPENDPDCVPVIGNPQTGLYVQPDCCTANGGLVAWNETANASSGLYPCLANAGSLPLIKQSAMSSISLINPNQLKSVISRMMTKDIPFVKGDDNTQFGTKILPYSSNDIVIKYKSPTTNTPQFKGESHRLTLSGYTVGNTRGYAYLGGDRLNPAFIIPPNVNVIIRVKGTATVVGGTSSTYTVGVTEAFAYYTAFQRSDAVTQLGTAGGEQDFTLRPSGLSSSCTLNIAISSDFKIQFGLDDSQTDTKRIWNLSVELDINEIENMTTAFDTEFAYYQNLDLIQLQNYDALIWN